MKIICFCLFVILPFNIFAWDLDWIDIIPRQERGADESLRYYENERYQQLKKQREDYKKYLEQLKESDYERYLSESETSKIREKRNEYISLNNPDSITTDETIHKYNWNDLWRPNSFKHDKQSIIIHHTSNDLKKFSNIEEVKSFVRNIYASHAKTRWWWDIWYNFVIGPFWNIYEWRSWWGWSVWAHSSWNNVNSIWIGLIWDFNIQNPTKEQITALVDLLVAISQKYDINPTKKTLHNQLYWDEPYILNEFDYSIIWHRDVWNTSCPGANFYPHLSTIRKVVANEMNKFELASSVEDEIENIQYTSTKEKKSIDSKDTKYVQDDYISLTLDVQQDDLISCKTDKPNIKTKNCELQDWKLLFDVHYNKPSASGDHTIRFETEKYIIKYNLRFLWQKDLDNLLQKKKDNHISKHWKTNISNYQPKIQKQVDISSAKQYLNKNVKVLLYELTQNHQKYDIKCTNTCNLYIDWMSFENKENIKVQKNGSLLNLQIDWDSYNSSFLDVINKNWKIVFENYDRTSYAGIPWNGFEWNIHIKKDEIKPLNQPQTYDWVVVNDLPFYNYMKWVVETNDLEHIQKNKIMALISKNYMLFYFDKWNEHPSIPASASYNAVDDARIFQKYAWAWVQKTINKWYDALEKTWDEIVIFDDYIPILPYFNCSPGFTWDAKERFWWTDTDYLQSRLDFVQCDDFNWHGVWLSGRWAEYLGRNWINYKQILKYYYPWVSTRQVSF